MIFDITTEAAGVEIGADGIKEIIQNVSTIMATIKGTVPLDRAFGVDIGFLDEPTPAFRALYAAEVVQAINKWEPRAEVVQVIWGGETLELMDGRQKPTVRIKIKEDVKT
jgi:phage baseplate assembly protein W